MTIGKNGKALNQGKRCMKTRENCKTRCCQARNTVPKAGDTVRDTEDRLIEELLKPMDKIQLIKVLTKIVQELCDKDESTLVWKDRKIKFRHYPRLEATDRELRAIEVTIEA